MQKRLLNVAAIQFQPLSTNIDENLAHAEELAREASGPPRFACPMVCSGARFGGHLFDIYGTGCLCGASERLESYPDRP